MEVFANLLLLVQIKKNGNGGITHTYGIKNGKQFLRRTINNDSI
jgi:hypothetical protein